MLSFSGSSRTLQVEESVPVIPVDVNMKFLNSLGTIQEELIEPKKLSSNNRDALANEVGIISAANRIHKQYIVFINTPPKNFKIKLTYQIYDCM